MMGASAKEARGPSRQSRAASLQAPEPAETLLVSDLHLSVERPAKLELFQELLRAAVGRARTLYVLGDLFEMWMGDDDLTPPHPVILAALATATSLGMQVFFMRGNRDFLVGERFAAVTGCTLLPDLSVVELEGRRALLCHGDSLCSSDRKYQVYRRCVDNPLFRGLFQVLPLRARLRCARGARRKMANSERPRVDVDQVAVDRAMKAHGARLLVHGHTHRQGRHDFSLEGESATRYVLGDWYRKDCVMVCREGDMRMLRVREYLDAAAADATAGACVPA